MTGLPTVECSHDRCTMQVVEVLFGPNLVRTALDPQPQPWPDGKIRIRPQWDPERPPTAVRLANGSQAFGVKLYRPHAEVCKGTQKRARQRSTSS